MTDPTGETEKSALRLDFDATAPIGSPDCFLLAATAIYGLRKCRARSAMLAVKSAGIWRFRVQIDQKSGNVGSEQACAARDERLLASGLLMSGAAASRRPFVARYIWRHKAAHVALPPRRSRGATGRVGRLRRLSQTADSRSIWRSEIIRSNMRSTGAPAVFIAELIRLGADPNYPDPAGFPPLIAAVSACRSDRNEILKLLLLNGADTTQRGIKNWTALHFAVARRDIEAVTLLLAHGADPHLKTHIDDCTSALEDAEAAGFTAAVAVMRKAHSKKTLGKPISNRFRHPKPAVLAR